MTPTIDLHWPVRSTGRIPILHHYQLLAGLSALAPVIHSEGSIGVHPIRGTPVGDGLLALDNSSAVRIRASAEFIPRLVHLGGKKFEIADCPIRLGVPRIFAIQPAEALEAGIVTIKGFMEPPEFLAAVRRQLASLGVREAVQVEVGRRRVLRIRGQTIVGFSLAIEGLSESESLEVQHRGVGGRRHFGCGLFHPRSGKEGQ